MTEPLSAANIQEILDASPFIHFAGMQVMSCDLEKGEVILRCPMRAEFARMAGTGQWHGGPIAAVIDTAGDFALGMLVGRALPTINFRVDYLRPAIDTALIAVARVRRQGRSVGIADVDVFDEQDRLVAIGRGSYAMGT
ncbi:PaaI family thioesterase [Acetobacter sp. TBRC 12305]|uniref:PaaI family thioesterase n=1 Tax=Acetobacter garciniae TaxID=2817435 RepID=A0A939KMU4_9PROT|nr:PaaI family thioesterase [Acetobacter garciniae]MBO1325688.1 PaaI family thioesterase [Acetobacter garciniae]MBX0345588.1 PaaI family thioesterase [Acetobacter garciniae]